MLSRPHLERLYLAYFIFTFESEHNVVVKNAGSGGACMAQSLSVCLQLRSWSQCPGIKPHVGLPAQWRGLLKKINYSIFSFLTIWISFTINFHVTHISNRQKSLFWFVKFFHIWKKSFLVLLIKLWQILSLLYHFCDTEVLNLDSKSMILASRLYNVLRRPSLL